MTETAGARAGARKSARGKGVTVERIFTTPGVHPYDEVTWEKRDVVQQNWKTGETIFDQRGWSSPTSGASTPAPSSRPSTSAAPRHPERETGLKQLIDRVVLTYVKAGKDHGYFGTPRTPRSSSTS
jgi:ribonucleoside-diphosphate reductase alpha chain